MADTNTNAEFLGNLIIRGKFKCLTGLHIGGSKEKLEIGGVDSPVIRDPRTRYPYVPGSSLKGKLRSLLEYALGAVPSTGDVSTDQDVVRLFGIGVDEKDEAKNPGSAFKRRAGLGRGAEFHRQRRNLPADSRCKGCRWLWHGLECWLAM